MQICFCGLGQMGLPMAARLLDAGHDVVVWNRSTARADALVRRGARAATTPAEASRGASVAFTMLSAPEAVRHVVLGPDGIASGLASGTLCEMSTIGPRAVRDLAAALPEAIEVLDAPVLGSVPQADDGSLKIFVGGAQTAFERHRALLETMGTPSYLGRLGSGAAMKLVVNSALLALMTSLAETLALADGLGLEEHRVLEVLSESPLGATVSRKRELIASGRFPPNFKLALAAKDARLVAEAARGAGVGLRLAPAARTWIEDALAAGLDDLDYSAVTAFARGREAVAG
jgi:3-hydroxyisobutyrate dehydrogenase-like beta-hydroxyacid dehydrogenase